MNSLLFALWNFHIIAESLPISSSGHLTLIQKLYNYVKHTSLQEPKVGVKTAYFSDDEEHIMHIPTLIIIALFLGRYIPQWTDHSSYELLKSWIIPLCITNGITGSLYLIVRKKTVKKFPLYLGFFITGCLLLVLSSVAYGTVTTLSVRDAILLGGAQSCALLPGISRLAVTFAAGIAMSLDPRISILFSLSAEILLIVVAVSKVLLGSQFPANSTQIKSSFFTLSFFQYVLLLVTSSISYKSLAWIAHLFIAKKSFPFAAYMLILAVLVLISKIATHKQTVHKE
ncbi:undecaprenyl-diphosphate phosphatase [Candidatus Dependentiae bacterium]|nr:undecaprenyl-diphosphate phosphatase [Candidatus Dependentiae bacterium]